MALRGIAQAPAKLGGHDEAWRHQITFGGTFPQFALSLIGNVYKTVSVTGFLLLKSRESTSLHTVEGWRSILWCALNLALTTDQISQIRFVYAL
ncbi:MAG: hypothetical protein EOO38_21750 [Cytophagaceae bacterium]|nr:MAG: hypothetical protein EOO38_21750 [Cytophagaceae bacterium]